MKLAVLIGILLVGISYYLFGGGYDMQVGNGFEDPARAVEIDHMKPLRIDLSSEHTVPLGVVLYAANSYTASARMRAFIRTESGRSIAFTTKQTVAYRQSGAPEITLFFSHASFSPRAKEKLHIEVVPQEKIPLSLVSNTSVVYSLLYPTPPTFAVRQGVLLGTAIALLLALFAFYKDRIGKYQWIVAGAIVTFAALCVTLPYLFRPAALGIDDWDYRYSLSTIYQQTITKYHQLPLWNPYMCGGAAALGDPEFALFTPSFALQFLLGVERGTGIALAFCFVWTGLGVLCLARVMRISSYAGTISALIVILGSCLVLKATEGHTTIIFAYMWVPWLLVAWKKSRPLIGACIATCMILQGGIYIISYMFLALLMLSILSEHRKAAIILFTKIWAVTAGLSAFQLIPSLMWLKEFPDREFVGSAYTFRYFLDIFFGRHLERTFLIPDQLSFWHEYGAYIGYGTLLLALIGASSILVNRTVRMLVLGGIATLAASSLGPMVAPLLAHLPIIPRSNISRLTLITVLCAALLAGFGIDILRRKKIVAVRGITFLSVLVPAFIAIDLMSLSYPIAEQGFSIPAVYEKIVAVKPPIEYTSSMYPMRQQGFDIPRSYAAIQKGFGTHSFCSVIGPISQVGTMSDSNPHPSFLKPSDGVSANVLGWSPNEFTLHVAAVNEGTIRINANAALGWHVSRGKILKNYTPLTLSVPQGEYDVRVYYRPPGVYLGIAITILCIIFLSIQAFYTKKALMLWQYPKKIALRAASLFQ